MNKKPEDSRYELGEDVETVFITRDETPEEAERKRNVLDRLKEKAGMASNFPSEEETLPGVETSEVKLNGHVPKPIDEAPSSEEDEIQDFDDDDDDFDDDFEDDSDEVILGDTNTPEYKPVVKQVVYGFYGLGPDDCLADTIYQMMPNGVFKAAYILAFPVEGSPAFIHSIKCGNTEQLIADRGVSASEFRCEYTLDLMIDRYFDSKSIDSSGIVHLKGDELDGRGHGTFQYMLETVSPGIGIAIQFTGRLRALLIIGAEAINGQVE